MTPWVQNLVPPKNKNKKTQSCLVSEHLCRVDQGLRDRAGNSPPSQCWDDPSGVGLSWVGSRPYPVHLPRSPRSQLSFHPESLTLVGSKNPNITDHTVWVNGAKAGSSSLLKLKITECVFWIIPALVMLLSLHMSCICHWEHFAL
jgi:hypothetical protein